jgi:serine/threonine protein kinase
MAEPGKYRVISELGSGGMGTIHKGALTGQAGFERPIVIKRLRYADDPSHVALFVEEARRYAVLDHENIGRIFDFERVGGELCIIFEYIDGWSVDEYLDRHRALTRFPDPELSVFIVSRVCRALQYVYEKAAIVHRDVSPSNVMMTREGTVKLIDFGIATLSGTRDSGLSGKPPYMAPETIVGLTADNRSDIFSLGTVLYEMLTLRRLFRAKTPARALSQVVSGKIPSPLQLNPDVPPGVLAILGKALERDPAHRYASAGDMGAACEHFLYDKGYGPTNLTLKEHLGGLFPETAEAHATAGDATPRPPTASSAIDVALGDPIETKETLVMTGPAARRPAPRPRRGPARGAKASRRRARSSGETKPARSRARGR